MRGWFGPQDRVGNAESCWRSTTLAIFFSYGKVTVIFNEPGWVPLLVYANTSNLYYYFFFLLLQSVAETR